MSTKKIYSESSVSHSFLAEKDDAFILPPPPPRYSPMRSPTFTSFLSALQTPSWSHYDRNEQTKKKIVSQDFSGKASTKSSWFDFQWTCTSLFSFSLLTLCPVPIFRVASNKPCTLQAVQDHVTAQGLSLGSLKRNNVMEALHDVCRDKVVNNNNKNKNLLYYNYMILSKAQHNTIEFSPLMCHG
jgi:hypothetical protein